MINKNANPLLVKTEQAVMAKLKPGQMKAFQKVLAAGLRVLDSEQSHKLVAGQLKAQADPTDIAGAGVAKLLGVLINQSKGTMPMEAAIPAATVLLLESLDRLEELGKVEINNDTLAAAMQSMSSAIMQLFGVTPQRLDGMMKQRQGEQTPEAAPEAAPPEQSAQPQPLIGAPA
jgi:phage-related tail protein